MQWRELGGRELGGEWEGSEMLMLERAEEATLAYRECPQAGDSRPPLHSLGPLRPTGWDIHMFAENLHLSETREGGNTRTQNWSKTIKLNKLHTFQLSGRTNERKPEQRQLTEFGEAQLDTGGGSIRGQGSVNPPIMVEAGSHHRLANDACRRASDGAAVSQVVGAAGIHQAQQDHGECKQISTKSKLIQAEGRKMKDHNDVERFIRKIIPSSHVDVEHFSFRS
ncbi:unnamed protein product [Pleuronectes platessa]|uniref:Uncharacterized protein n=1 Tax=Pleuronectes platessa TaxID=8262 RepID=A0A9N7V650_PLEPL|nr:unnamed protein product [Pleuronectes platessa]